MPRPPFKLAPPITTAAIASSSHDIPIFGDPKFVLEATIIAAVAAKAPEIAYTKNLYLLTLIPDNRDASSLLPIAIIKRPNTL